MKKIFILFLITFYSQFIYGEKLYQSTLEKGEKPFTPSEELKQKVSKKSGRPIGTEKGEFSGIFDKDFYELPNGNISYGPDVSYMHYRLIFDKEENWLETQELFHSDVTPDQEYYKIRPKIDKALSKKKKKYLIAEDTYYYTKVTNRKGFWYEIEALRLPEKSKRVILLFNKQVKLIGERKGKLPQKKDSSN
ncbi:MAG: hypothetical protein KBA66_18965 [Leptospiraceae bacterium]|nr:hypothetical protein [Leptospiraceae bacterium]